MDKNRVDLSVLIHFGAVTVHGICNIRHQQIRMAKRCHPEASPIPVPTGAPIIIVASAKINPVLGASHRPLEGILWPIQQASGSVQSR
jgi:hypothetical protein